MDREFSPACFGFDVLATTMIPLTTTLLAIGVSGAVGGTILGITQRTSYKIRLPLLATLLELGFVGDALIGAASAVAVLFFAAPLLDLSLTEEHTVDLWLKIISLGVLSGLAGVKLLTTRNSHILERLTLLDDRVDHTHNREKLNDVLCRAASLALENRTEHALAKYDEALRTVPRCEAAYLGKAKILHDRCKWDGAISTLSRLLEMNPLSDRVFYLRACYKSAAGKYRNEEILQDLKSAVARDPLYKTYAALQEKHFENLRDDPEFHDVIA